MLLAAMPVIFGFIHLLLTIMDRLRITETLEKSHGLKSNIIKLMILGKIVTKGSKLHIYNWIKRNSYVSERLGIDVGDLKLDDLYFELGEFSRIQTKVEKKWNVYHRKRHKDIYLYDITSSYFEGTENALSAFGYNRDGKRGKKQITIGLITDSKGFPLKIQVFEGNEVDYKTVNGQLKAIREKYKELQNVEHAFRDMKTDKLNIRPIYHINEDQTKGHVFVCMFSYAIVKEIETVIYPWLKTYNLKNNCKLSYHDITDELNNIKVSELEVGYKLKKILIPELNFIQSEMTKLFDLKIEDVMSV